MFRFNDRDTFVIIVNFPLISHFTPFSGVSVVEFEQVNICWL